MISDDRRDRRGGYGSYRDDRYRYDDYRSSYGGGRRDDYRSRGVDRYASSRNDRYSRDDRRDDRRGDRDRGGDSYYSSSRDARWDSGAGDDKYSRR